MRNRLSLIMERLLLRFVRLLRLLLLPRRADPYVILSKNNERTKSMLIVGKKYVVSTSKKGIKISKKGKKK